VFASPGKTWLTAIGAVGPDLFIDDEPMPFVIR
jgi:hypothetical protein